MTPPPRSGEAFLVRSGHFFFRYRDAILPGILLTLLLLTRPRRPFDSDELDGVMDAFGLLVICAGQVLRIGTIGYAYIVRGGKDRRVYAEGLVTSGLFGTSRNPLYLGNLLIYAGLLIVWNNPWVYVVGGPFFVFLYRAIVAAEEEFLHAKFGPGFERYCRDVGTMDPRSASAEACSGQHVVQLASRCSQGIRDDSSVDSDRVRAPDRRGVRVRFVRRAHR